MKKEKNNRAPKAPDWLSDNAKRKWKELTPELKKRGLLTAIDKTALALLCLHYDLAAEAGKTLKAEGTTVTDERGLTRKHPACQVLRDNSQSFARYMAEFGLSPSSRNKLIDVIQEEKEPTEFEKQFGGRL